jgi:decaprenyl-diphosphate synthase subunit 2
MKAIMGSAEDEWKLRETLGGATSLGKSCQAALMLSKHSKELQKEVYFFGKHLYLGWKASKDLELFASQEAPARFSLTTAPVLFHLEYDHSLYDEIKKGLDTVDNVDYAKIYEKVRNGPGLEKTRELLNKNNLIAKTLLYKFPQSRARTALENIILALED